MTDGKSLGALYYYPIIGTGVSRHPVDNADVSGDGCPSSLSLRTVSPSSELTLGGEVVYRPIGEALSHRGIVATAWARARGMGK